MRASILSSIVSLGVQVFGAIGLLIGSTSLLLASEDCLPSPSARTAQGEHWYYYSDPTSKRKCWFRREQAVNAPEAAAPKRAAEESESPSLLSRLVSAMRPNADVEQPSAKNPDTPNAKSPDPRAGDQPSAGFHPTRPGPLGRLTRRAHDQRSSSANDRGLGTFTSAPSRP